MVPELQLWLSALRSQIGACLKANPRAAPPLLDRARARFKAANQGEHRDLYATDCDLKHHTLPLVIIMTIYLLTLRLFED